ncbi:MAG: response regulator [Phycisphaerales bacterium]|nr:response regulator [Phycisphaerales bacterium]
MESGRPKLLVVAGEHISPDVASTLLGGAYRVEVADGRSGQTGIELVAQAAERGFHAVLLDTGVVLTGAGLAPTARSTIAEGDPGSVLSAIGEGVCLATTDGQIVWANDRFKSFDEQTRTRIGAVCRRAAQQFEEQIIQQEAAGFSAGGKFEVASADESKYFEVTVSLVKRDGAAGMGMGGGGGGGAGGGGGDRVAAVVWDVTQSRRTQQKMDAIDRAGAELVRLDAESIRKKHVVDRLKLLEEKIVRFSHDLLQFDHLAVRLLDERTGKLELVIASGLPPEAMEVELYAQREGNGIMGYVAASGRSYICPDVSKDRRYVTGLHGARSSLTVPLRLHDKVIGAFNVESERLGAFTEEDRQFAEFFSNHIALSLHILDLLVVERCATGETVTGTVQGELNAPLDDIMREADVLRRAAANNPELGAHVDRIIADVNAIRQRVKEAAGGPQTILGAEKALADVTHDPLLAGRHVLVADDEPKIRQIIREVLRNKGCRVAVCGDGTDAIKELEASIAAGELGRFDLVISDIKMPDRNGYEVFAAARRVDPGVPVILMTGFGYDPHHSIVRASQEGLQCVLFKPFQIERLLEEVRKAMVARGARVGAG